MTLAVQRSRQAERDVASHARYLAEHDPRLAARFLDAFERIAELLAENPGMGARRSFPRSGELRFVPLPRFREWLLFYREEPDRLLVVRIIHAKQNVPTLFGE